MASSSSRLVHGACNHSGALGAILSLIWLPQVLLAPGRLLAVSVMVWRLLFFWRWFWWLRPFIDGAAIMGATGVLPLCMYSLWVQTLPSSSEPVAMTQPVPSKASLKILFIGAG